MIGAIGGSASVARQKKGGGVVRRVAITAGLAATAVLSFGLLSAAAGGAALSECPPIGRDTGCQFLITITNRGLTLTTDPSQGAYEGNRDSPVGVRNTSSRPLTALYLSTTGLFRFDGDGMCNNGSGPAPPGCQPPPGSSDVTCNPSTVKTNNCSFPPPPGEPPSYTEPGAANVTEAPGAGPMPPWPNGDVQNGYEGPTTWFSSVSTDQDSGVVNFSPALAPGDSTFFSLEEPLTGATIRIASLAPTTTSTMLSGDGLFGTTLTVPAGTPARDWARIGGAGSAATVGGSVSYTFFTDRACTSPLGAPHTANVTGGKGGPSSAMKPAPGTYYPRVTYSGDAFNAPSMSPCGSEILRVATPFDAGLPAARRCLSGGTLILHLRKPKALDAAVARLEINGKVIKLVKIAGGHGLVALRKLPRGTFHIEVVVPDGAGGLYEQSRAYRSCMKHS